MTTIEEFLQERGGRLCQDDVAFLAKAGLASLMPIGADSPVESTETLEPSQELAFEYYQFQGMQVACLRKMRLSDADMELLRLTAEDAAEFVAKLTGAQPRTLVVGSDNMEEAVAVSSGCRSTGINNYATVREAEDSVPEQVAANLHLPVVANLGLISGPVNELAYQETPHDLDLLVICNPLGEEEIAAWVPHLTALARIVVVNGLDCLQALVPDCHVLSAKISVANADQWSQLHGSRFKSPKVADFEDESVSSEEELLVDEEDASDFGKGLYIEDQEREPEVVGETEGESAGKKTGSV